MRLSMILSAALAFAQPAAGASFDGLWETDFGRLRLVQEGSQVRGLYSYSSGSTLTGTAEGPVLTFTYAEPAASGEGRFELSKDKEGFSGRWRTSGTMEWKPWKGRKVQPIPGRRWLVVIEARWESALEDPEYSFGDMLKAFFAKDPGVRVRHRYFTDEASLSRWVRELAFLAEPVVLSIATHGTPEGIKVDGRLIGARSIAESLRYVRGLSLLHFSSCLMLKDRLAGRILEALGGSADFPISGYANSIDWGASAASEFLYFDLILSRGMEPREAARRLKALVPYVGADPVPQAPFEPFGFRLIEPRPR